MRGRDHCVGTYSALGQLVSENLGSRYFGNKGVFIGGGGDDEEEGTYTVSFILGYGTNDIIETKEIAIGRKTGKSVIGASPLPMPTLIR